MTSGGLAAVTSSFAAALCSAFGKYDVVHIHAEGPAFFAWLPKLFGKKVVVTIHGLDWQREKWRNGFGSKFIRQGEKNAVKYADEIIVLSKGVQDYFKQAYGRDTHFIPNGVNKPEPHKAELITEKFGLSKDTYILFLGRLVPEKGICYLVEAFQQVKTDKKLVIAGGSSDTDAFACELKNLAKDDSRIVFTGFVQGQLLDELYSNAYIYTLPSDLEGMPLSLLEAMSYGNCCLVSDIPECTEVVEDKAFVFKKPSSYMVRSMDYGAGQVARALLSERYRRIDNMEIATAVLPLFAGNDQYEVMSCEVTENRLYLKVVNHRLEMEVSKGDIVQAGVMISNSEVGLGAVSIQPLVYRLVCTNGMVVNDMPNTTVMVVDTDKDDNVVMRDCVETGNSYCLAMVEENGKRAVYPFALSTFYGVDLRATVIPIRYCPRCGKRLRPHMEEGDTGTLYYTCNRCGHREESWLDAEELDRPEKSYSDYYGEDETDE